MDANLIKIRDAYEALIELNHHTEAASLLVDTFGTKEEAWLMLGIKNRQYERGYITLEDHNARFELSNKYFRLM